MQPIEQRLASAVLAQQAGRIQEAEAVYREALAERPNDPDILHLLGLAAHQSGRHAEAIDLIREALGVHGRYPLFHSNLSAVYLTVDRLVEAALHAREAIRLKPTLADAHQNLGHALRRQGQLDEAAAAYLEALHLDPKNVEMRCHLGGIYQRRGKVTEAVAVLKEAVRLAPGNAQARNSLGEALTVAGSPDEALVHLQEAVRLRPNLHGAWNNLGFTHEAMHHHEEAIGCFREALRIEPRYGAARNNLAYTQESLGRTDEARAELEETLRRDPKDSRAYSMLARFVSNGHYRFREDQLRFLHEQTQRRDLPLSDYYRYHHALSCHYDKAGQIEEAFYHCHRSKEYRREWDRQQGIVYDPEYHRQDIDRIIAVCTPEWFEKVRSFGSDSELPIFIIGMMRSGTTLAEQILASHPLVHGPGELMTIDRLIATLPQRLGTSLAYPESLNRLDAATAQAIGGEYLKVLRELGAEAQRVVDKMPFNFINLGLIAALFPKARIIHCTRDAADTCCSCYFQYFASPHPFTYDLQHLGHYYSQYERLMAHWAAVLPIAILDLKYEELIDDPEKWSRQMVAFCGLEWDERCLRFHENRRVVRTASAMQVRKGVYRSSIGRWQRYEKQLQPLLDALGRNAGGA